MTSCILNILFYKEGSESGAGLLNLEKQTVIHWKGGRGGP